MTALRTSNVPPIWDFRDSLFRALAAAYAALGEDLFRRELTSIAAYYGEGATFSEIEDLFTKHVPAEAELLKTELASRRSGGRETPPKGPAQSRRPPLLNFDDEDLSVLSPREVDVLKARSKSSIQESAKRLQIINGSARISPVGDVPTIGAMAPPIATTSRAAADVIQTGPWNIYDTGIQSRLSQASIAQTRKRRFSEVHDSVELQAADDRRPRAPPRSESFGYVTRNGEYRCALCQRQLPNENDLKLHEQISREHTRSLKDQRKVTLGRERLAHLAALSAQGYNANPSVLGQRLRIHNLLVSSPDAAAAEMVKKNGNRHEPDPSLRQSQDRQASSTDIGDEGRWHPNTIPATQSVESTTSACVAGPLQTLYQGKCRADSLMSASGSAPAPETAPSRTAGINTRSTTARTEIGTLNTPQTLNGVEPTSTQQPQHNSESGGDENASEIPDSVTARDISRLIQLNLKLLNVFQKSASARDNSSPPSRERVPASVPDDKSRPGMMGINNSPTSNSTVPTTMVLETLHPAASCNGPNPGGRNCTQRTISAPGIGVHLDIKRGDAKENGKKKDVGEPICMIVLD
ncbi:hypothetical protein AYO21_00490 [Fonsecaea monophora]|uniref:C2H2-type domain-containing protein n=1 Tax=Fonsecaea monophora TaxID=254056 RepID=A0A177FP74_9EURO|nr:hypothetical protein AYO21_00490 [Fonsecaea monophora]OAG45142.1 hypothetical protein AYO21_00490 [Fonsecaea monophora]